MNFDTLKKELKEIAELSATVPEPFQQRCFEILLGKLLDQQNGENSEGETAAGREAVVARKSVASPPSALKLTPSLRVLMRKTGVTVEQLEKVVMVEGDEVHFLREPKEKKNSEGQLKWALLTALKSALLGGPLAADPEAIRSNCQEKGFYDTANFAAHFKRDRMTQLFKKPLQPQGPPEALTNDGMDALGKLIQALASQE